MENEKKRNRTGKGLILISYIFLIPGLVVPMVTLSGHVEIFFVKKQLFKDTRSIVQTIDSLVDSGNYFVAALIFLFSVLVPLLKGILLLTVVGMKNNKHRFNIYSFIRNIGKWAMADVFVIGVFVAFLAAKATRNMDAEIEPGFYFFVAYCIFSLLALQFMKFNSAQNLPKSRS